MRKIPIKCGCYALVDDDMYDELTRYKWRNAHGYAVRDVFHPDRNVYRAWGMHNQILPPKPGVFPDHIDRNPLNNQRHNLRYATHTENIRKSGLGTSNTSGYKGVSWLERDKRWIAWIHVDGQNRYIGSFTSEIEAAYHYNCKAGELWGDFAWLNPLPENYSPPEGVRVRLRSDSTNPYAGIVKRKDNGKWSPRITVAGQAIHFGQFDDPHEAAYVYDQAALQFFGKKARLNFL